MEAKMESGGRGSLTPALRPLAFVLQLALLLSLPAVGARAQSPECDQLRAALAQPVSIDAGAAAGARKARADLDHLTASAHAMGCDNQQFLIFGSPPPPQCGGVKARIAALQSQFDALAARSSGDSPQRRALRAHYDAVCNPAPREKNFFEQLFGGGSDQPVERTPDSGAPPQQGEAEGNGARGGSQAVCVRSCDGGFFPLNFSARSGSDADLENLCQALCPNTEVKLFTRSPNSDISTALGADGTAYSDLPNALKYTKSFDPSCACKPPNQSWVEALAHAEQVLDEMGGAKASDTTVTEQQSKAMAQPLPAKAGKTPGLKLPATNRPAPTAQSPSDPKLVDGAAPDGSPRQVRVVGPTY